MAYTRHHERCINRPTGEKRSLTCEEIYDAAIRRCFQFSVNFAVKTANFLL